MASLFISYSSADRDTALAIAKNLAAESVEVWLDEWTLGGGGDVRAGIQQGIARADHFCLLFSATAARSDWVTWELACAQRRRDETKVPPPPSPGALP